MPYSCCYRVSSQGNSFSTVEKPAFKSMRQTVRVSRENLLLKDYCTKSVWHGTDIDKNLWMLTTTLPQQTCGQVSIWLHKWVWLFIIWAVTGFWNPVASKPCLYLKTTCHTTIRKLARIWRVVTGWKQTGLYHHSERVKDRSSSEKVELVVPELLWSQFTFGSHKHKDHTAEKWACVTPW